MCDHCHPIRSAFRRMLHHYGNRAAIPARAFDGLNDSLSGVSLDGDAQ